MKKLFLLMIAALALSCGSCAAAGTAQAKGISVSSRGSIIYQQDGMNAALYAEDLLLLKDKLSTIPEDTFDPGCYAHTAQQEVVLESVLENMDEGNNNIWGDIDENGFYQDYDAAEEERTEREIEEETEMPVETETGDDSTPADPSEGNSQEDEDIEDISPSTETSEEDPRESEDTEDISAPTETSEEDAQKNKDAEDVSAPAGPPEENTSESEDAGDGSALKDMLTEDLLETKTRDVEKQVILQE